MAIQNRELALRSALTTLEKAGCIDQLVAGEMVEANKEAHMAAKGPRGKTIAKVLGTAINEIVGYHQGLAGRVSAADVNFNASTVCIKDKYLITFAEAIKQYFPGKYQAT